MTIVQKGVLFRREGAYDLALWRVDRDGEPHHVVGANQRELMGLAEAFVDIHHNKTFDLYTASRGPLDREALIERVNELRPELVVPRADWAFSAAPSDAVPQSPFEQVPDSAWVVSNDLAYAIYDRFPVSEGHILAITKRRVPSWLEATTPERLALMALVDEAIDVLKAARNPDGFNVGFNAGAAAGQTVQHLHVHVIPRYEGDMPDPRGGLRHVIPQKGNYLSS